MATIAPTPSPEDDSEGPLFIVTIVAIAVGSLICFGAIGFCCKRLIFLTSPEGRKVRSDRKKLAAKKKKAKEAAKRAEEGKPPQDDSESEKDPFDDSQSDMNSTTRRSNSVIRDNSSYGTQQQKGKRVLTDTEKSFAASIGRELSVSEESDDDYEDPLLGGHEDAEGTIRRLAAEEEEMARREYEEENYSYIVPIERTRSVSRPLHVARPARYKPVPSTYVPPLVAERAQMMSIADDAQEEYERQNFLNDINKKKRTAPLPLLPFISPQVVQHPYRPLAELAPLTDERGEIISDRASRMHRAPSEGKRFTEVHPADYMKTFL